MIIRQILTRYTRLAILALMLALMTIPSLVSNAFDKKGFPVGNRWVDVDSNKSISVSRIMAQGRRTYEAVVRNKKDNSYYYYDYAIDCSDLTTINMQAEQALAGQSYYDLPIARLVCASSSN
jgi:hypothetical protein